MQNLLTCVIATLAAAQLAAAPARASAVLVRAVIDGDTIDVTGIGRVRLLGIDAPELGHGFDTDAPFARQARDRLLALVFHRWVRLEQDGARTDAYQRRLAYVLTEDGVFVNGALVREGLARVSARERLARLDELTRAEAEARRGRRGMWGAVPQQPAAGYTRRSTSPGARVAGLRSTSPSRPKAKQRGTGARTPTRTTHRQKVRAPRS